MTDDLPRSWWIHLGVHKTATTHIQQTLELRQDALRDQGVRYVPVSDLRAVGFAAALRRCVTTPPPWRLWERRRVRRAFDRTIADLRALGPRLVLSEENVSGNAGGALVDPLYPEAPARIAHLLGRIPARDDVHLLMAIRSFDTLAPSAFAQSLRLKPPAATFDEIAARVLARPPSWFDLVARIRAAAPRATLAVWRYEDYRTHRAAIVGRICGVDPGPLPDLPVPARTRTPSHDAVAEAQALPGSLTGDAWRAEVARVFAASRPDARPFAPFSDAEAARLRAAYRADVERIAALEPRLMMTFDDSSGRPVPSP